MAGTSSSQEELLNRALARVAELETALLTAERKSKSLAQELQHFVYAASHDLQEPLRAVATYSQLLQRRYSHDSETCELTGFITSGVDRMNALLHNLLVYSRINPAPVLSSVDLNAAVQAAVLKLSASIKGCGAIIRFSGLPSIPAHEVQLMQLFEQILSNALLYRREQPEIDISAEESELDGEPAQIIRVRDNGVGIEAQFLEQVVQPFKRLHGKNVPGNGLGLAICEKIACAHRGKLWLESDGHSATTVHVALPC